MPNDNENIPLPLLEPDDIDSTSGPQAFAPDQMVACEECLRTNPPTRLNCLYCGVVLPKNEVTLNLQKPTLRRLEKWELGYNTILVPRSANGPAPGEQRSTEVAEIVKLSPDELTRILSSNLPLPLARAATPDEAALVERRLNSLGVETRVVSDAELGVSENGPAKVRAMKIDSEALSAYQSPESPPIRIGWVHLNLVVTGRLISTRVELKEEKASRAENRILDSSQFFSDEVVFEFFSEQHARPFRVAANSFDFSCLGDRKRLVSVENMTSLLELFRENASGVEVDQSYNSLRKTLDPVWPPEQQIESSGWRRERPGKYSIGSLTEKSNEAQFMRYSLLRRFLQLESRNRG